jgi:hypothetical protein
VKREGARLSLFAMIVGWLTLLLLAAALLYAAVT